jgi:glutathione S-transferase
MKLYSMAASPYAARVRGAIYAKNLPVEIITPPEGWRNSAEFRALNPLMKIPVLVLDDGTALAESPVIVEYLEDAFPQPSLRPKSAEALAQVRLITQVADVYVQQAMMPLFYLYDSATRDEGAIKDQLQKLHDGLGHLDSLLTKGGYAHGDRLTTADVWLTPVRFSLNGLMIFSGRADLLKRHKAVDAYADAVRADGILNRVWQEMDEGLRAFLASRPAQKKTPAAAKNK